MYFIKQRNKLVVTIITVIFLLFPALASAHVIVTPSRANVGQELLFNVSSPNEQQTPIIQLTLNIPSGVTNVVPTEKDGWTITTKSEGTGSTASVSAIVWSSSQIPVGQREDFTFSAQVPGSSTSLDWKAFQQYADGTVVHWDQKPNGSDDSVGNAGPYSVTSVVNDLTSKSKTTSDSNSSILPTLMAAVALIISVATYMKVRTKS